MRYIGNKSNIIEKIYSIISSKGVQGNSIFDLFAGTASVGIYFKQKNYSVYSSDLLFFSYILQRAYIVNNTEPTFDKLLKTIKIINNSSLFDSPLTQIIAYLNCLEPKEGFIYNNYTPGGSTNLQTPRMFFSDENGKIIDAIRQEIELWKSNDIISEDEYFILLASLIESVSFYSNVSGVYAAFQKKWDPRAVKKFTLRPIKITINQYNNYCFNIDSSLLLEDVCADIFYLDPPYNQRQYAPNYHLLETIAKYDNPIIRGVSGMRNYEEQKSKFCNKMTALQELELIAIKGKFKYLVMSYNSEGIMEKESILSVLNQFGESYFVEFDNTRFKSNSIGINSDVRTIKEHIYILNKND